MASNNKTERIFPVEKSDILPFGTNKSGNDLVISIPTDEIIDRIVFFDRKDNKKAGYGLIDETFRNANIYSFRVKGAAHYNYVLLSGVKPVCDTYAKVVQGSKYYGVYNDNFDWEDDTHPNHNYEDSFIYRLHVRGFTKHSSSKVKAKGTFAGIVEKIDYFKELGITAIELMPSYEFDSGLNSNGKINYWGYGPAYYFAPKESYSSKKKGGQVNEFKFMVKQLHKAGIEVIMDFYFVPGTNPYLMIDCLRHWVLAYHIDGIHVNTEVVPSGILKEDPILTLVKIFADNWDIVDHFNTRGELKDKRIAIFNDDFMINVRKFIKSDEGQVGEFVYRMKRNPANCGIINYLANHYTFTLMDTVSFNMKHNEDNGENNQDGTDYNYSWNCGVEGQTRKKKINELRMKQIKNALTILFMSQGTPMIYSGDEMGKSQRGNNNPYCQDNPVSWINWNQLKTNSEIFEFVKKLIKFRADHKMLHLKEEPKGIDYLSKGLPDVSVHGVEPWMVDNSHGNRQAAILYNGEYNDENSVYVAFNMYWEDAQFSVPELGKGRKWKLAFRTDSTSEEESILSDKKINVPARTIVVLEEMEQKEL